MGSIYVWGLTLAFLTCLSWVPVAESKVVLIGEDDWKMLLEGEWMIEFFAPWCPACRALHRTWEEFSTWTHDLGLDGVAQVDVTENPGLSGRFVVTALPTIYHVKDGVFRQYRGARDKDSFISFVEDKRWQELDPIPSWKNPDSFQMTAVSYFFKMSMALRNVHTVITEDYGYPYWVSYVSFAVATIILGAILGLALVCCIDLINLPKRDSHYQEIVPPSDAQKKKNDDHQEKNGDDSDDQDELPEDEQVIEGVEKKGGPSDTGAVRKRRAKRAD